MLKKYRILVLTQVEKHVKFITKLPLKDIHNENEIKYTAEYI